MENCFQSSMLLPHSHVSWNPERKVMTPSLEYITMLVLCPEEVGDMTSWIAMYMSGPLYVTNGQMERQVSVAPRVGMGDASPLGTAERLQASAS